MRYYKRKRIQNISKEQSLHLKLLILHVVLGLVMTYAPNLIKLWYILVLSFVMYQTIFLRRVFFISLLLTYNLGIEMIGRMAGLSPIIPWELCKYLTGPIVVLGLMIERFKYSNILGGVLVILLCIPSIILGESAFERILFSMFGLISLGLGFIYFWNRKFSMSQFLNMFRAVLYPMVSILVHITIETPSFSDMEFELGANFQTTGGFGSNQVSTILGMAAMLIAMVYFVNGKLFAKKWIDLSLLGYFLLRGLLSFSRGGVLTAVVAFVVFFIIVSKAKDLHKFNLKVRKVTIKDLVVAIACIALVFLMANNITGGVLLDRYKGETGGTMRGEREKTLNSITTGRFDILVSDIEIWRDYPFWGVGAGKSAKLRVKYGVHEIVAHTEYSRMLAEQGIFGLTLILFFTFYIPFFILSNRTKVEQAFLMAFVLMAILTSFHAGMRTFTTPLFLSLSVIRIRPIVPKRLESIYDGKNDKDFICR